MRERKEEGKNLWDDHAPFPPCVGPPGPLDDVSSRPDGADDGRLIEVGGVSPRRVERLGPRRGVRPKTWRGGRWELAVRLLVLATVIYPQPKPPIPI